MSCAHEACFELSTLDGDASAPAVPSVLIVDDRPANLLVLEAILERLPARLVRAQSGEEALVRSSEQEFALVLLDWQMPELDGIEVARRMRERAAGRLPPIIMLTAHLPDFSEVKTAYAVGVVDFLQKPYAPEVLVAKTSVFIELYAQREKLRLYEHALRKRFEEDLVGIVSHDLRSPLNAISLAANSMLRRASATESEHRLLRIIHSSAGRAARLVHDLLDYTQVLHGTAPPIHRDRFCLLALVQEILDELRASFPTAEFVVEHCGSTEGLWDRDRLAQVIANLVSNAATYGSGAPIVVRVAGQSAGTMLEVHNTGEPIPHALIPELFEPMRRHGTRGARGNLGLGLFIVREIARAHGGSIAVRSGADGTTFSLNLPATPDESGVRLLSPQPLVSSAG